MDEYTLTVPKGLVVYLDDETHKKLKAMSVREGKTLKDCACDIIKNAVDKSQRPDGTRQL